MIHLNLEVFDFVASCGGRNRISLGLVGGLRSDARKWGTKAVYRSAHSLRLNLEFGRNRPGKEATIRSQTCVRKAQNQTAAEPFVNRCFAHLCAGRSF